MAWPGCRPRCSRATVTTSRWSSATASTSVTRRTPRHGSARASRTLLQPHAFIPRGRLELREHLRDVYDVLLAAGAHDVDLRRKLPGAATPEDADLQYPAVRRPLIEWGLRRAVTAEAGIRVLDGAHVTGPPSYAVASPGSSWAVVTSWRMWSSTRSGGGHRCRHGW